MLRLLRSQPWRTQTRLMRRGAAINVRTNQVVDPTLGIDAYPHCKGIDPTRDASGRSLYAIKSPRFGQHGYVQCRHKSVFVSKHNQSLNVTAKDILDHVSSSHYWGSPAPVTHKTTATHVILQDCPFCTKPVQGKQDNQYKLYVQLGGGAYFCHRCGTGGSWFDFVDRLGTCATTTVSPTATVAETRADRRPKQSIKPRRLTDFLQQRPAPQKVPCLPMPSPRLQALYSSQLLDQEEEEKESSLSERWACLEYLQNKRGLTLSTLRRYGVGLAHYSFPQTNALTQQPEWVRAACVTFPWIMTVNEVAYQEELRGAQFEYTANNMGDNENETLNKGKQQADTQENADSSSATTDPNDHIFLTRRIKARALDNKSWQRLDPPGGGWGLFGYHTVPADSKEVILTEGEYDAMAVWQATGRPAVSLPNGCRSLPVQVLPQLERFDKVFLWMDHDGPGQEGAELFGKKIGLERCFMVRPTKENTGCHSEQDLPKDANDALMQGLDLDRIIQDAKLVPHERILTFADLKTEVLHEIMHPEKYVGTPVVSLPKFTNIVKGLRRGELTVLTGPTGSGKTTLLGQLSLDLAEQDINVLWGSFEIKNTRLMHKLLQQFAREPLPTGDASVAQRLESIAHGFEHLPLHFLKFHGGSDVDDILDAMDYAVYVNDAEHIILDNMQFMISRQSSKSSFDKFDVQDIAIEKFRKFCTDRNVHITLVVHPKKQDEDSKLSISSIYGSAKVTQEADTVLILQNEGGKKYLDVRKNRFNGELGQTELFFDRQSCRYSEFPPINVKPATKSHAKSSPTPIASASYDHWEKRFA